MNSVNPSSGKQRFSLPAPAKINLCLKVIGQRPDGYHNLQTVFQFLDLHDQIHFTETSDEGFSLTSSFTYTTYTSAEIRPNGDATFNSDANLILKAAYLLKHYALQQQPSLSLPGFDIELEKNLPIGGGIGGGSSNAASTLLALNKLWQLEYNHTQLSSLAEQLGADVPIFLSGQAAFAEGKGELLQTINLAECWYLLIKPKASISTAEIFGHQQLTRDSSPRTIRAFLNAAHTFTGLKKLIEVGNDCEELVKSLYPQVSQALEILNQFSQAQLTGTGACIFAPFEDYQKAEQALEAIQTETSIDLWLEQAHIAQGLNSSPVHKILY